MSTTKFFVALLIVAVLAPITMAQSGRMRNNAVPDSTDASAQTPAPRPTAPRTSAPASSPVAAPVPYDDATPMEIVISGINDQNWRDTIYDRCEYEVQQRNGYIAADPRLTRQVMEVRASYKTAKVWRTTSTRRVVENAGRRQGKATLGDIFGKLGRSGSAGRTVSSQHPDLQSKPVGFTHKQVDVTVTILWKDRRTGQIFARPKPVTQTFIVRFEPGLGGREEVYLEKGDLSVLNRNSKSDLGVRWESILKTAVFTEAVDSSNPVYTNRSVQP